MPCMICQTERCKKHNIPLSTKNRERDFGLSCFQQAQGIWRRRLRSLRKYYRFAGKDFTLIYTSIKHLISFQLNERLITGPGVDRCNGVNFNKYSRVRFSADEMHECICYLKQSFSSRVNFASSYFWKAIHILWLLLLLFSFAYITQ